MIHNNKNSKTNDSSKKRLLACKSKHRHPDELTARAVAMDAIEKYHNVDTLYVYHCPFCSGWHLSKKGKDIAVTEKNPFDEQLALYHDFLTIIKTGPIWTISDILDNTTHDDAWLYHLCLKMESKDEIYRSHTTENKIEWQYKTIKQRNKSIAYI